MRKQSATNGAATSNLSPKAQGNGGRKTVRPGEDKKETMSSGCDRKCTHELPAAGAASLRPTDDRANQHSKIEREGDMES